MEKENIFVKYAQLPPTPYFPSSTSLELESLIRTTSNAMKLKEEDGVTKNNSDSGIATQSHEKLNGITLRENSKENNILDDSHDEDFQDCQLQNNIKSNLEKIKRRHEDESFLCAVCQKDLTNSDIEERSTHVNQCIDYHSSVAASSEEALSQESNAFILDCPLCFKHFPSPELRSAHIKKCGKSRGLSVQSVIQAIHLQEKHVLERRALGLPLHRINQTKQQKKNVPKKFSVQPKSAMQSDIQLAKALSLSLTENESQSQQNVINDMDIIQVAELQAPSESHRPGKSITKKKKPMNYTYPLLLTSEEERGKIILEKVNALIAPVDQPESDVVLAELKPITANQKIPFLWSLSSKAEEKSSYYVQQLLDWILPSDIETGSKLCNLSQIPGHRIFTQLPCDYTFSSSDKTLMEGDTVPESSQLPSLVNSLQSLIGNSWMSDIDIHTASGIVIPAHKLILALRCSALRNAFDEPPSGGKHILNWQDTSFDAALHFLNFVYTGTTEWKEDVFNELVQLAKKYEVEDLLYILNNSCETMELITDDEICNESNKDVEMSNEGASNGTSVSTNRPEEKALFLSENLRKNNNSKNTSNEKNLKDCDKPEQSFKLTKKINRNSTAVNNPQKFDYSSADCTDVPKQDGVDPQIIYSGNENICDELHIVGRKFNDLITKKDTDIQSSTCIESSTCKMNIDSYPTDSESSNDSCKIVKAEIPSPYTPNKNITRKSVISPISSLSSQTLLAKNNISPMLLSKKKYIDKIVTPEKYECLCSETTATERNSGDSNEDVIVLEECRKTKNKVSPISLTGRSSLKNRYKLNRFSEAFSSPFQVHDENDDFNSAICLSQNTSLQAGQVNLTDSCELNLNISQTSFTSQSSIHSLSRRHSFTRFDKIHEKSDRLVEKVADKTGNIDFSKQMSTDAGNGSQEKRVSSPEIFICDSDNEVTSVLGENYFQEQDHQSLGHSSGNAVGRQNSLSNSFGLSLFRNNENLSRSSVIKSDKRSPPEIIYCDTSAEDYEQLTSTLPFLKKASELPRASFSSLGSDRVLENLRKKSNEFCQNVLTSPESPWVFGTEKQSNDSGKSTCSSQLNSCTASEYDQKKKRNTTPTKNLNANFIYPTTPRSSLIPNFKISDSPITPFPDYNNMHTPEIKEALKKIGVKALPRKKAVAVLSHVYDETHPWNDGSSQCPGKSLEPDLQFSLKNTDNNEILALPKKRKQVPDICDRATKKAHGTFTSSQKIESVEFFSKAAQKTTASCGSSQTIKSSKAPVKDVIHFSSQASCSSKEDICTSPTHSCHSSDDKELNISGSSELSDCSQPDCKDKTESIKEYILSNEELHQRILSYKPLNLVEFQQELKHNGMKVGIKKLMDYLDEQCITFTCPRKEEYKKKQQVRTQRFRKRMLAKLSQQGF